MSKRQSRQVNTAAAIVYCRVSAQESQAASAESASLEQQERTLTAAALAAGYTEIRVIIERHTASKEQPGLEAALEDLSNGLAAALYIDKVDRLTRKGMADAIRVADHAERYQWRLVIQEFPMGTVDTASASGRIMLGIMAEIARQESKRRSERMRSYHAGRRARGEQSGRDYGRRTLATDATITEISSRRAAGQSWRAITDALNAAGADGRRWHPTAVRRVAASPMAA